MKVICFRGQEKTGKTTLIKRILRELFNTEIHKKRGTDFVVSLIYKDKLIGICSYGDSLDAVKDYIEIFIQKQCDIIICASRTSGDIVEFYESKFGKNIKLIERNGNNRYFGETEFQQFIGIFDNLIQG